MARRGAQAEAAAAQMALADIDTQLRQAHAKPAQPAHAARIIGPSAAQLHAAAGQQGGVAATDMDSAGQAACEGCKKLPAELGTDKIPTRHVIARCDVKNRRLCQ